MRRTLKHGSTSTIGRQMCRQHAWARRTHLDVYCGREAAAWIRDRADQGPFYLQVNLPGPHSPFDATSEYRDRYNVDALELPILGTPNAGGALIRYLLDTKPELQGMSEAQARFLRMTYFSKISLIDDVVADVLAAIEDSGISENTWVIYGSDHGELAGDHELWGKVAMFEGSLRIPLIVRPPGGTAPWRSTALVDQRDVTATILDLAGTSGPGGGQSLLPQILAGAGGPDAQRGREHVVAAVDGHFQRGLKTAMVHDGRHKLVYNLEDDVAEEVYDLEADPREETNRLDTVDSDVVSTLLDALFAEIPPQ